MRNVTSEYVRIRQRTPTYCECLDVPRRTDRIHASKQEAVLRKAEVVIRIRPMRTEVIKADYPVCNMADTVLEVPSSEALIEAVRTFPSLAG